MFLYAIAKSLIHSKHRSPSFSTPSFCAESWAELLIIHKYLCMYHSVSRII